MPLKRKNKSEPPVKREKVGTSSNLRYPNLLSVQTSIRYELQIQPYTLTFNTQQADPILIPDPVWNWIKNEFAINVEDLRELLQTALEQQGDSLDPTGYAYVSVEEGSNYAALQSQDPLDYQDTSLGEPSVQQRFENIYHSSSRQSTVNTPKEDVGMNSVLEEAASEQEEGSSMFLADLSLHILDPIVESGTVSKIYSKCQEDRSPPQSDATKTRQAIDYKAQDPLKLEANNMSVAELREMLQAALEREEHKSAGSSRGLEKVTRIDESEDPVREVATIDLPGSLNKQHSSKTNSAPLGMNLSNGSRTYQPVTLTDKPNTIMVEIVQRYSDRHYDNPQDMIGCENEQMCNKILQRSKERSPLVERNKNPSAHPNIDSINQEASITGDGETHDWENKYKELEKQFKELSEKHKKCKQKFAKLEADKLSADDYSLRMGKEMMQLKDKQMIKQANFTEEEGISITLAELQELNGRAETDSLFVGLLATRLIGAQKLVKMSVTGQASHRFAKLKNPDGTPMYPAAEGIDAKLVEFICNKVAERTAMRIGPENVGTIRKRSELVLIKKFIGQKIANLKKAVNIRKARTGQDLLNASNIRL